MSQPFSSHLAAFKKVVGSKVTEQHIGQARVEKAFSAGSLTECLGNPATSCIFLVEEPLSYSKAVLSDPREALACIGIGNAIGTWNAEGTGTYAAGDGWLVADVELVQEQAAEGDGGGDGDFVSLAYALFRVDEGWAGVLWDGPVDKLKQIAGLEKADLKKSCTVWYGE